METVDSFGVLISGVSPKASSHGELMAVFEDTKTQELSEHSINCRVLKPQTQNTGWIYGEYQHRASSCIFFIDFQCISGIARAPLPHQHPQTG